MSRNIAAAGVHRVSDSCPCPLSGSAVAPSRLAEYRAFVLGLIDEAIVEEVRRRESKQDAAARAELARTSWLWRKNPENWTERESGHWEQLQNKPLVTGLAYSMRLELQRAYQAGTVAQARERFLRWCAWVRTEATALTVGLLEPMRQAAEMVERHLEGILAHWQQGLTTAFLEGLNSLFSAVKRKARGYRSSEYQTAMLYFVAGKLEIPYYG